jgi:hypothetical protein
VPLFSSVAECHWRAEFKLPVTVKVPLAGSKISALDNTVEEFSMLPIPPAINTFPLFSTVAE